MNATGKSRTGTAKERSVFVGNIPYDVTEEMLKEIFSEAGSVVNFRLVTDRETGKPKGYGFCEYADGATALSAMRNLNGYEINGRNLRVDFADGGDKSSSNAGGDKSTPGVSGEVIINAIETAINKFGPLKLYDLLVDLKEHARQRPEYTKSILTSNPALTHAIVQCFKTLNIPIPASTEAQPALLSAPPMHQVPMASRPIMPIPQRPPVTIPAGPIGGILGMAPLAPPAAPVSTKTGGTRWSARPGPLSAQAAGPAVPTSVPAPQGGILPAPPQPPILPTPILSTPAAGGPQVAMAAQQRNRDPRRAAASRDPRLAKRPLPTGPDPSAVADKRPKTDEGVGGGAGGQFDAIAELARDMTPQKLDMLPPNERQILLAFMQANNIPFAH